MPVEKINWDKHDVVECDDRGRATLGSKYANERVFVYVAELPDESDVAERVPDAERRVLGKMRRWAKENDIDTMTHLLDPVTGVVTDKHGDKHDSPYQLSGDDVKDCPPCDGSGDRETGECSICGGTGKVLVER